MPTLAQISSQQTGQAPKGDRQSYLPRHSSSDKSVNWVCHLESGSIEARFVQRRPEYFAAYLSSQTGCRQGCRMCHLTATGQTQLRDVTMEEYFEQAEIVLDHFCHDDQQAPAEVVHFNFMARGEPLANRVIIEGSAELLDGLWARAKQHGLRARFLVSTIFPRQFDRPLEEVFDRYQPEIYYSLYTTNESLRKRWLPNAQPAPVALDRLVAWQRHSYKLVKIHFAFIEGVNDSELDVHSMCDAIEARALAVHVNIVRYNPPSPEHGREPSEKVLARNAEILRQRLPNARVQIVPRVGFDVNASCGMFVAADK